MHLVSVIINSHNGSRYIKKALNSLINQTYSNIEIIVWDNASTDSTKKIVKNFKNKKIKYFFSKKFEPLYTARNNAIRKCNGKYICFCDVDDLYFPKKIEKQIISLIRHRKYVGYSNLFICKNFNNQKIHYKKLPKQVKINFNLLKNYHICIVSLIFDSKILKRLMFNSKYNFIGDFDLVIRLSKKFSFDYIHEPLAIYNIHEKNLSNTNQLEHASEISEWIRHNRSILEKFNLKNQYKNMVIFLNNLDKIKKLNFYNFLFFMLKQPLSKNSLKLVFRYFKFV